MGIISWFAVTFSVVLILIGALYLYLNVAFLYWRKRNFPYLRPTFPFGNLGVLLTRQKSMGEVYADIYRQMYGMKFGGVYLMHRPQFIVRDPEMIRNCLIKDFEYFHDHGFVFDEKIDPLTGNLFMLNGKKWKDLRAVLSPTFSSGKMKIMFETMVECGQGLTEFLDEYAYCKDDVEMNEVVARFTTDVIASCAFGIQCNCLKHPDAEFRRWGKRMIEQSLMESIIGILYVLVPSIPIFFNLPLTSRSVSDFFRKVVRETIEFREKNAVKRNDFLQLLIDLKDQKLEKEDEPGFTMDEITAQVIVFFVGGFETTSVTMSFCLYELAMNMDVQTRLSTEINTVLEQYDGRVTYEAIKEMKYLDKVVSETLRKYPPVTFLNRHCTKDYKIPETDLVIEKGVQMVVPVLGLHKDPEYFPDPEKFDPERFNEETKSRRPNYVYLPFGDGPRVCIGKRFGVIQTKVGLVCLLSKYEFQVCDKTADSLKIDQRKFIMTPTEGVWLQARYKSDPF